MFRPAGVGLRRRRVYTLSSGRFVGWNRDFSFLLGRECTFDRMHGPPGSTLPPRPVTPTKWSARLLPNCVWLIQCCLLLFPGVRWTTWNIGWLAAEKALDGPGPLVRVGSLWAFVRNIQEASSCVVPHISLAYLRGRPFKAPTESTLHVIHAPPLSNHFHHSQPAVDILHPPSSALSILIPQPPPLPSSCNSSTSK